MVEVFLGVASRYSYLASTQIEALEADTGCKVIWRPLFSADLMALRGDSPFKGDPATAVRLRDTTREAHKRGAFGVPTFFVDDRIYWGNDRLVLLRHHLAQRSGA